MLCKNERCGSNISEGRAGNNFGRSSWFPLLSQAVAITFPALGKSMHCVWFPLPFLTSRSWFPVTGLLGTQCTF